MSCGCKNSCRCGQPIDWRAGIDVPKISVNSQPCKGWMVIDSRLIIKHHCLIDPIAVIYDVYEQGKRLCDWIKIPDQIPQLKEFKACETCHYTYEVTATMTKENEYKTIRVAHGTFNYLGD